MLDLSRFVQGGDASDAVAEGGKPKDFKFGSSYKSRKYEDAERKVRVGSSRLAAEVYACDAVAAKARSRMCTLWTGICRARVKLGRGLSNLLSRFVQTVHSLITFAFALCRIIC